MWYHIRAAICPMFYLPYFNSNDSYWLEKGDSTTFFAKIKEIPRSFFYDIPRYVIMGSEQWCTSPYKIFSVWYVALPYQVEEWLIRSLPCWLLCNDNVPRPCGSTLLTITVHSYSTRRLHQLADSLHAHRRQPYAGGVPLGIVHIYIYRLYVILNMC